MINQLRVAVSALVLMFVAPASVLGYGASSGFTFNGGVWAAGTGSDAWDRFLLVDLGGGYVGLQAASGMYVVAENGGGDVVNANRGALLGWETFQLIDLGGGYVALRAANGQYISAESGGGGVLLANRDAIGGWETFLRTDVGNGLITLQAYNGQYLSAPGGLLGFALTWKDWWDVDSQFDCTEWNGFVGLCTAGYYWEHAAVETTDGLHTPADAWVAGDVVSNWSYALTQRGPVAPNEYGQWRYYSAHRQHIHVWYVTFDPYGNAYWNDLGYYTNNVADRLVLAEVVQSVAVPASVSVSPSTGTGPRQTFVFQFTSSTGEATIGQTWHVFHPTGQMANSCVIGFYHSSMTMVLWDDSGTGTPNEASAPVGSAVVMENSQCRLHMAGSTVAGVGDALTVVLDVSFKPAYAGAKSVFMHAQSTAGVYSSQYQAGQWTIPTQLLTGGPVTPSNGAGLTQTFTVQFGSSFGADHVGQGILLIAPILTNQSACQVFFSPFSQELYLSHDVPATYSAGAIGSGSPLQNSQCTVYPALASATPNGTTWTVTMPIAFKPSFVGAKNLYVATADRWWTWNGWQDQGDWTVECTPGVTPLNPTVAAAAGQLTFSIDDVPACPWTASAGSFLTLQGSGAGNGAGQVSYSYTANPSTEPRSAQIVIANRTITVIQIGSDDVAPGDEVVYYHFDLNDSLRMVTDANGAVLRRHDYQPFGQEVSTPSQEPTSYAGLERDPSTGLNAAAARYYDAIAERFTTPDPIAITSARLLQPYLANRYTYANQNPFRYVDPGGLDPIDIGDGCIFFPGDADAGIPPGIICGSGAEGRLPYCPGLIDCDGDGVPDPEPPFPPEDPPQETPPGGGGGGGPVDRPGELAGEPSRHERNRFRDAKQEAEARLQKDTCKAFFGPENEGLELLRRTRYRRYDEPQRPGVGAFTFPGQNDLVYLNQSGPMFERMTDTLFNRWRTEIFKRNFSQTELGAVILLHELGHQRAKSRGGVTDFTTDGNDTRLNEEHTKAVIAACF